MARHLELLRDIQKETGGFTEFVPARLHPRAEHAVQPPRRAARLERLGGSARARGGAPLPAPLDHQRPGLLGEDGPEARPGRPHRRRQRLRRHLMEESISRESGSQHGENTPPETMRRLIREMGRTPVERSTTYKVLRRFDDPAQDPPSLEPQGGAPALRPGALAPGRRAEPEAGAPALGDPSLRCRAGAPAAVPAPGHRSACRVLARGRARGTGPRSAKIGEGLARPAVRGLGGRRVPRPGSEREAAASPVERARPFAGRAAHVRRGGARCVARPATDEHELRGRPPRDGARPRRLGRLAAPQRLEARGELLHLVAQRRPLEDVALHHLDGVAHRGVGAAEGAPISGRLAPV